MGRGGKTPLLPQPRREPGAGSGARGRRRPPPWPAGGSRSPAWRREKPGRAGQRLTGGHGPTRGSSVPVGFAPPPPPQLPTHPSPGACPPNLARRSLRGSVTRREGPVPLPLRHRGAGLAAVPSAPYFFGGGGVNPFQSSIPQGKGSARREVPPGRPRSPPKCSFVGVSPRGALAFRRGLLFWPSLLVTAGLIYRQVFSTLFSFRLTLLRSSTSPLPALQAAHSRLPPQS